MHLQNQKLGETSYRRCYSLLFPKHESDAAMGLWSAVCFQMMNWVPDGVGACFSMHQTTKDGGIRRTLSHLHLVALNPIFPALNTKSTY
jgi:hypothetical protein